MEILAFECGPLYTNAYLVANPDNGHAILIDCPPDALRVLKANGVLERFTLTHILITHAHWDHTGGAKELRDATGAKVLVHADDAAGLADPGLLVGHPLPEVPGCEHDGLLKEGIPFETDGVHMDVLYVPGHTRGHVALYYKEGNALFAGDVLFMGSIGRTDLPGGDYDDLMESIRLQILPLPDETTVYPGHGPATNLGQEKEGNPFILDYLSHFT